MGHLIFALLLFVMVVAMLVSSAYNYPPAARQLPLVVGIPAAALLGLQIIAIIRGFRRPAVPERTTQAGNPLPESMETREEGHGSDEVLADTTAESQATATGTSSTGLHPVTSVLIVVGLFGSIILAGSRPVTVLFPALILRGYGKKSVKTALLFGLPIGVAIDLLFVLVLRFPVVTSWALSFL